MNSPVSRRRLLTSGFAASFLAASGASVVAGPRIGGLLRLGLSGHMGSWDTRGGLDPFRLVGGIGTVFDSLTEIAADGVLRPELATAWRATEGARVWQIALRPGVTFHNGAAFGPEDVIASLMMHEAGSPAAWIVGQIADIRRSGDLGVTIELTAPNADFPILLADPHLAIYPAGQIAEAMETGIGTGLYRSGRSGPGERLTFWRVEDHYKGNAAGQFTEVEIIALDAEARHAALAEGKVHAIDGAGLDAVAEVPEHGILHGGQVAAPQAVGTLWAMDNGRIAERWWRA